MESISFPSGTKFFDVDGVPVSKSPDGVCTRSDCVLYHDPAKVWSYGTPIDETEFKSLASQYIQL